MKIAVIPARGGSKRIPRKNVRPFCGRPMIAWAIDAARGSGLFDHVIVSTDDGSRGEHGRVTVPLERTIAAAADQPITLYACGPTPMMRAVARIGARVGKPVFVSLEPVMGCGMGGCYSCVVRVRRDGGSHFVRSCLEGPVFDAATVVWEALGPGH